MKLFAGSSHPQLAREIANALTIPISPIEQFIFPDGERRIQIQERVVDEDTIVVQSTNPPVDSNYLELFLIVDGLKRSGARSVTVVMPYMGYMRQDHIFRDGEAVSLLVMIKILETLGVDRFIGFDFHTVKLPEFFHIPVSHLSALPLFAKEIKSQGWDTADSVLVSPDMGGIRRIQAISQLLDNMPWTAAAKSRDLDTGSVTISSLSESFESVGVKDKRVLMVDDMISSGGTIIKAASLLKDLGAKEVHVFVTHPIFSKDAPETIEASEISRLYVTDTVALSHDKHFAKLNLLSIADQIANELKNR